MTVHEDPEGIEITKARGHVTFSGRSVLEIGCGEGRLTFQYAPQAKSVVGIDPSASAIAAAKKRTPKNLVQRVRFQVGRGEQMDFPDESFDLVFFSWSLCCADIPAMGKVLDEACRVLKPKSILLNIQASLHQPFHKGMISYLLSRNWGPSSEDESDRHSRLALRYASLVQRKFDFIAEEEFPVNTYYDSVDEVLREVTAGRKEDYRALDREARQHLHEIISSLKTRKGVRIQENAVLTVLRKASPRGT
ncbi:MAG: methyltransferase domain-containing protein [Thaumarchaeota archaeon]|nr:MAG: methyltransferase domain-containing protein [Nitrososphaerota archaeon]